MNIKFFRFAFLNKMKMFMLSILIVIGNSCVTINYIKQNSVSVIENKYFLLKKDFKWMNEEVYRILKKECTKKNLDIRFVCSLIQYESGDYCNDNYIYMTRVVSYAGAVGLMQIMSCHTPTNPQSRYNPEINIQKGTSYLAACIQKAYKEGWKNPLQESIRYYNAGMGSHREYYRNWKYVNNILKKYYKC